MNSEQLEAMAVDILKGYTADVYVGPDIDADSMENICTDTDDMVYLQPVQDTDTRVLMAVLKTPDDITRISKELIPLCYVIGNVVAGGKRVVVKWYSVVA